ncbi:hypothetical protein GCK72_024817 [Caenorhabditis remanei]|uniref:Uncharacterized protein n=1 Tax=Caenorhabditis remanei TaxID=31234 RepID=A0A6A5G096_CAERE|nr:hypothetical protein GCK72_024817 [Caenorhabditis remanei]KAF1748350.1 hypothetical protein GCK72_024817 [Caenorhabditis remanei]
MNALIELDDELRRTQMNGTTYDATSSEAPTSAPVERAANALAMRTKARRVAIQWLIVARVREETIT